MILKVCLLVFALSALTVRSFGSPIQTNHPADAGNQTQQPSKSTSAGNAVTGAAKVSACTAYSGQEQLRKPQAVVVNKFTLAPNTIVMDDSLSERLHRHHEVRHGSDQDSSPESLQSEIDSVFMKALVSELAKSSFPIQVAGADLSSAHVATSLSISGEFTSVNQGDRGKRVLIGLGRGASGIQAKVTVTLIGETTLEVAAFTATSGSGKKPGVAETMWLGGPAVAAVMASKGDVKETVEADTVRLAKVVAQQIVDTMKTRQWIQTSSQTK